MTKPRLTVRDMDGTIYFLQSKKMVEPSINEADNHREVLRSSLKDALKTGKAVYSWYNADELGGGSDNISVGHLVPGELGYETPYTFHVGCRRFDKPNAKKLIKWAEGK